MSVFTKTCGVLSVKGLTFYTILYTDQKIDLDFAKRFLNDLIPVKCGEFLTTEMYFKKTYVFHFMLKR